MGTVLRWLLILVGAVVGLLVLLSVTVLLLVDPNDYRQQIAAAVSEQTGREFVLEGDLSLRTFPCCGLQLGSLSLGNPLGWQEPVFARVGAASLSVQVWPLLRRQELRVGRITLDDVGLLLISRRDGSVNWSFGEDAPATTEASTASPGLDALDIAGVRITNSRLEYRDEATGERILLTDLNLDAGAIRPDVQFPLEISLQAEGLVPDILLRLGINARAVLDSTSLTLDLLEPAVNVTASGADLPGGRADVDARLTRLGPLGADSIAVQGLDARIRTSNISARLAGNGELRDAQPDLQGTLVVDRFDLRKLLQQMDDGTPPDTADPAALTRFDMAADWRLNGDRAALENIKAQLDDSAITGAVRLTSIERESISLELDIDRLDADRYLPPDSEDAATAGGAVSDDSLDLPVEELRALDLQGRIGIGALTFSGARLSDVNMQLRADKGVIRLNPLTGKLYGGTYSGDVRFDVRGATPRLSVNETLGNIQIADLLRDASDKQNLAGRANARITATATGNSVRELLTSLEGDTALDLQEGLYLGVDLWYEIRKARALLQREAPPAAPLNPQTELSQFAATAQFDGGTFSNRDLQAQLPFLRLSGNGSVNLLQSTLDYNLQARVVDTPRFADGEDLSNLRGLTVPIRLRGALDSPSVSVDLASLAASAAASAAGQKVRDRLTRRLGLDEPETAEPTEGEAVDGEPAQQAQPKPEEPKDVLKRGLRDLINR